MLRLQSEESRKVSDLVSTIKIVIFYPCMKRPRSNWNLKVLVFEDRGKPEYPDKKPPGAKKRTNKNLNRRARVSMGWQL